MVNPPTHPLSDISILIPGTNLPIFFSHGFNDRGDSGSVISPLIPQFLLLFIFLQLVLCWRLTFFTFETCKNLVQCYMYHYAKRVVVYHIQFTFYQVPIKVCRGIQWYVAMRIEPMILVQGSLVQFPLLHITKYIASTCLGKLAFWRKTYKIGTLMEILIKLALQKKNRQPLDWDDW